MCVHTCMGVCQYQLSFSISLHLIFLRQGLSLNRQLSEFARLTWPASPWEPPLCWGDRHIPPSSVCWGWNSGFHICTVGTLLAEPSPQSYLGLWFLNTAGPSSAFSKPPLVRNYIKGTLESTFAKSQETDAPGQGRMALPAADNFSAWTIPCALELPGMLCERNPCLPTPQMTAD